MSWETLPALVIDQILSLLALPDAFHAALSCRQWFARFNSPGLWRQLVLRFANGDNQKENKMLSVIDVYGGYVRELIIKLDQSQKENRTRALQAIDKAATVRYSIQCTGNRKCVGKSRMLA